MTMTLKLIQSQGFSKIFATSFLLLHFRLVLCSDEISSNSLNNHTSKFTTFSSNFESSTIIPIIPENIRTDDPILVENSFPSTCEERNKLKDQATQSNLAKIRKCCPMDENIRIDSDAGCAAMSHEFKIRPIEVEFFDDCIEDTEKIIHLELETGNPCNLSYIYRKSEGDLIYVIQNGSLLVLDENRNFSYDVLDQYCVDMDLENGELVAIVCISAFSTRIATGLAQIYTILMAISMPCLILIAAAHFSIPELRTLHGLCFGSLCSCLFLGFLFHSIMHFSNNVESKLGYAVQFFLLSYYTWLFSMTLNLTLNLWIYTEHRLVMTKSRKQLHFISYLLLSLVAPSIVVGIHRQKSIPGIPSYFLQGWNESLATKSSQKYFMPTASTILLLSVLLLGISHYKIYQLKKRKSVSPIQRIDELLLQEARRNAQNITFVLGIVMSAWILEVIRFNSPGLDTFSLFIEVLVSLQGVFILLVLCSTKSYHRLFQTFWKDSGSYVCADKKKEIEMTPLKSTNGLIA